MAVSPTWQVADELFELLGIAENGADLTTHDVRKRLEEALENRACAIIPAPAKLATEDPTAAACPHCHAVNPKRGINYGVVDVPQLGEIVLATVFCGECRVMLATQILEMQTAALAAQKAGLAPASPGGLWTPPGRRH